MPKDISQLLPLASISSTVLNTMTYQAINPGGLPYPAYKLFIKNASDEDVLISIDGVTEYEFVEEGERIKLDGQNNSGPNNQKCYFPKGMVFYASGTAGTGDIFLTGLYQPE